MARQLVLPGTKWWDTAGSGFSLEQTVPGSCHFHSLNILGTHTDISKNLSVDIILQKFRYCVKLKDYLSIFNIQVNLQSL